MPVVRQNFQNSALAHHVRRNVVGQTVTFIKPVLVKLKTVKEIFVGRVNDSYVSVEQNFLDIFRY